MKNIIQLYFDNDKKVPFVVRRANWGVEFALVVIDVIPKKSGKKWYGKAFGFALPCINSNPYWGTEEEPVDVSCAGAFQWEIVEDLPAEWKEIVSRASKEE